MTKQSGLGDNLYVDGFNISGDVQGLVVAGGFEPLDVTGIDKSAFERIAGRRDGRLEATTFFNDATGQAHEALSGLPTTDVIVSYLRGTALGSPAASLVAKQVGFDPTRGEDGMLTLATVAQANSYGVQWGHNLTGGVDTLGSAAALDGFEDASAATDFGLQAFLHVFSFTGTSATVAIQDSDDDAATDAYANVVAFTAATAAGSQRVATSATENVKQWLRVNVTGTFTDLDFAVVVVRNETAVTF